VPHYGCLTPEEQGRFSGWSRSPCIKSLPLCTHFLWVNDQWLDSSHDFWWLGFDSRNVENDGDSTWVTFFTEWLDASHNQWFETLVTVICTKSLSLWWTNTVYLHAKNFLLQWLATLVQFFCFSYLVAFLTYTELDLRLCFSLRGRKGTIYWHIIVVECSICQW